MICTAKPRKPRTRLRRVLAAAGGFAIVLALLFGLCYCNSDPFSRFLSKQIVLHYLETTYPGQTFTVCASGQDPGFQYVFEMQSPTSPDTVFHVWTDFGKITWDTYDMEVTGGMNTRNRLANDLYRDVSAALAGTPLQNVSFSVQFNPEGPDGSEVSLPAGDHPPVTLDMPYDKQNLPAMALVLDLQPAAGVSGLKAAADEALRQAKAAMEAAGIDMAAYQVAIWSDMDLLYRSPVMLPGEIAPAGK